MDLSAGFNSESWEIGITSYHRLLLPAPFQKFEGRIKFKFAVNHGVGDNGSILRVGFGGGDSF